MSPLLLLVVLGCVGSESPDTSAKAPRFSDIRTRILDEKCTYACHSGGEFAAGGLDLETDPYGALVGAAPVAAACGGIAMSRVSPGHPEASLLYRLLIAKDGSEPAPCGDPMPQGADRPALSAAETESIRAWIAAGAPRN